MKKILFTAVLVIIGFSANAQSGSGFGIKGGLNYNQNGDLKFSDAVNAGEDVISGSKGKVGYHIGFFGKLELGKIYLRPELVYTKTKSDYNNNGLNNAYDLSKLDIPVLIGVNIVGPLHAFIGPDFQYILNNDLKDIEIDDVKDKFTYGLQMGVGVNLGKLGFDVRYERGLTDNEARFADQNNPNFLNGRVDSRPSQIIFGLSIKL